MVLTARLAHREAKTGWMPWVGIHAGFGVLAIAGLLAPAPMQGWRVLCLVVIYHVAVITTARLTGDELLWRAWTILAPLSLLMVLPDWFLSAVLGVLHFPDNGGPSIGSVPLAMAGMWTIALLPVVAIGCAAADRFTERSGVAAAASAGAVTFGFAELAAPALGLWEPIGVETAGGVAIYVLLPEVVLSVCAYLLVRWSTVLPRWSEVFLVVLLPFTYLGLLAASYQFLG